MGKTYNIVCIVLIAAASIILFETAGLSSQLNAVAVAERSSVFTREPFLFQIQVNGTETPSKPDMPELKNASITYRGGQQNSSSSVTIINGKMTKIEKKGYVFSYQITPLKTGPLTIPPIKIIADSQHVLTNPVTINVKKPIDTKDFKLRLSLSKDRCYVGEPVILTVTWYLAKDVRNFDFSFPFLENNDFDIASPRDEANQAYINIPLKSGDAQAKRGRGSLDGEAYTTISFSKVLMPKHDGTITLGPAIVVCEALEGYRKRRSPFGDDFFSDFFNNRRQGIYRKQVAESNTLSLQVSDVPEKGRPDNFAGHIGNYRLYAQASPTDVNVGDPITLNIALSGPAYLDHISLPPLKGQKALSRDFKIPDERAAGEMVGDSKKVFTQTIRALRQGVNAIPSIELPFFNTETGRFDVAKTEPIPINVRETKIITVLDAEGTDASSFAGSELETWESGIRYNYESPDIIEHQYYGPFSRLTEPVWLIIMASPPLLYMAMALTVAVRRYRRRNSDAVRAGKAFGRLKKALKQGNAAGAGTYDQVLNGVRSYLEDRLETGHRIHTFADVGQHPAAAGIDTDIMNRLKALFEKCEQGRYSGKDSEVCDDLPSEALALAKSIEKALK